MTLAAPPYPASSSESRARELPPHRGRLALALQESLTAIVRHRAGKQVATDAESFRTRFKQLLRTADDEARAAGYAEADVRLALFAVVVFLDESIMNAPQPMFAQWPRRPLQEEIFGGHMGGELFFQYLQQLLGMQESESTADVLEVYQLCMLLGFRGRFGGSREDEAQTLISRLGDRIERTRGGAMPLAPAWRPVQTALGPSSDPWAKRLMFAGIGIAAVTLVLFIVFTLSLGSDASDLRALVSQLAR